MTNDVDLFEILSKQKSKLEWGLGFTNSNKKNIFRLIKEMPIKKLESEWVKILNNDSIIFHFNIKKRRFKWHFILFKERLLFQSKKMHSLIFGKNRPRNSRL